MREACPTCYLPVAESSHSLGHRSEHASPRESEGSRATSKSARRAVSRNQCSEACEVASRSLASHPTFVPGTSLGVVRCGRKRTPEFPSPSFTAERRIIRENRSYLSEELANCRMCTMWMCIFRRRIREKLYIFWNKIGKVCVDISVLKMKPRNDGNEVKDE